jgi:2'-5' RNA ligase
MALAVCLLFDSRSDRLVRELWARLEAVGIGTLQTHTHRRHLPHLSYAVLREWDPESVVAAMDGLEDGGPVSLSCHGTLMFPRGRVALAPAIPAEVATRQDRVARALGATGADLHRHYEPGQWVPHVSVATRAAGPQLETAVRALSDVLPLRLTVERAALIDSATGVARPLDRIP